MELTQERRVLRTVFTKEANQILELISNKEAKTVINAKFTMLTSKYEKLVAVEEAALNELMKKEDSTDDAIEAEMMKTGEYDFKYLQIKEIVQEMNNVEHIDRVSTCSSDPCISKLRLPKMELKKFDGELKSWIGFWSQFSKIHENDSIKEEDKFEYLIQTMKPGSPAQKLIEGFPPSRENYGKAVDLLKSRFGREELLIEYYVRELLSLVLDKTESLAVAELYDRLEAQLRALDSLKVTKEKYAAMLFPLVESAIPDHIFKIWERHRISKNASNKEPGDCLTQLLDFLKIEVEGEERLKLRSYTFENDDNLNRPPGKSSVKTKGQKVVPTAATLVSSESFPKNVEKSCIFCSAKNSHNAQDCSTAIDLTLECRNKVIKEKGACFRCLRKGHLSLRCKTFVKCVLCKGRHYALMCGNSYINKPEVLNAMLSKTLEIPVTYLQTLVAEIVIGVRTFQVRVLCDSGSQRSYITKQCVRELNLRRTGKISICQELFGGQRTALTSHSSYNIVLKNPSTDYTIELSVLDQNTICSFVPRLNDVTLYNMLHERGINISDFSNYAECESQGIQILIGADAWARIISHEVFTVNESLVAINTFLGWTLIGSSQPESTISSSLLVTLTCQTNLATFWDLELMGIKDPGAKLKQEEKDQEVQAFFNKSVYRASSGRYIVKLPWVEGYPLLYSNREVAEKRLMTTTRKLQQIHRYEDYDLVFKEWLKQGIIEKVEEEGLSGSCHYLPHRAVLKENSTTKVRPVFDASNKDKAGHALNDSLEKGPNLIELIPHILTNFRIHKYGVSADIEKAFLQICLDLSERDKLRFLWWEAGKIVIYRHCRVVFGVSCSPFLLGAVLSYHFGKAPPHLKSTADLLKRSFYVDNCLLSLSSKEEIIKFKSESKEILSSAGFNLRGWISNSEDNKNIENILGIKWYCSEDTLSCNVTVLNEIPTPLSKRMLLAIAQRIYDPIGFTAPTSLVPKMLLQKCWSLELRWDDHLPYDILNEFSKWVRQLPYLTDCKIPRRIFIFETSSLHVFCDASKNAFAACIFLRSENQNEIAISLLLAKSRVAPVNELTLPRLELMAALLGLRLSILASKCLSRSDFTTYYWSDSTVTLAWIGNQGKWSVFVNNRVKEINEYSSIDQWRYVPGTMNPADLLSRGCMPAQLLESRWCEGPTWLRHDESQWPSNCFTPNHEEIKKEKRRTVISANNTIIEASSLTKLALRFSKYTKIVRTVAWILRLVPAYKKYRDFPVISNEEFLKAEIVLLRHVQQEAFEEESTKKKLKILTTFYDGDGLLRMRSRLLDGEDSEEMTYPIILPSKNSIVLRLIEQQHISNNHAGTLALILILRERFWILSSRRTVGKIVRRCAVCRRFQAKSLEVPTPPLPKDRTGATNTFQVTGTDLAGPLYINGKGKCWVVLFTCAVYRAVHLELVLSLSTGAYIQALRRFIARRGRVSIIYSDNGTNFTGTSNALDSLDWSKIEQQCYLRKIKWKFNPVTASWWGGFWERLIGILKDLLKKNLGHASLNYEELYTLLCEIESIMNNRPLTYLSEDPNELSILKPSMFLMSLSGSEVTDGTICKRYGMA